MIIGAMNSRSYDINAMMNEYLEWRRSANENGG